MFVALQQEKFPQPVRAPPAGRVVHFEQVDLLTGIADTAAFEQFLGRIAVGTEHRRVAEDAEHLLTMCSDMVLDPCGLVAYLLSFLLRGENHDAGTVTLGTHVNHAKFSDQGRRINRQSLGLVELQSEAPVGLLILHGVLVHEDTIAHGHPLGPRLTEFIDHLGSGHSGERAGLKLPAPQGIGHIGDSAGGVALLKFFKADGHHHVMEAGRHQVVRRTHQRRAGGSAGGHPQALLAVCTGPDGVPQIRLVDHFEQLHVTVDDTVHIIQRDTGIRQCFGDRLVNHLRLINFFAVTGVYRLPDTDDADISVFLHGSPPLCPRQCDNGMKLPGRPHYPVGQSRGGIFDLVALGLAHQLQRRLRSPNQPAKNHGIAGQGPPGGIDRRFAAVGPADGHTAGTLVANAQPLEPHGLLVGIQIRHLHDIKGTFRVVDTRPPVGPPCRFFQGKI